MSAVSNLPFSSRCPMLLRERSRSRPRWLEDARPVIVPIVGGEGGWRRWSFFPFLLVATSPVRAGTVPGCTVERTPSCSPTTWALKSPVKTCIWCGGNLHCCSMVWKNPSVSFPLGLTYTPVMCSGCRNLFDVIVHVAHWCADWWVLYSQAISCFTFQLRALRHRIAIPPLSTCLKCPFIGGPETICISHPSNMASSGRYSAERWCSVRMMMSKRG